MPNLQPKICAITGRETDNGVTIKLVFGNGVVVSANRYRSSLRKLTSHTKLEAC